MKLYFDNKPNVKEEKWIDNSEGAKLLVRGRTNSLNLSWRNKFVNGEVHCACCGNEVESLAHFLLDCSVYTEIRTQFAFILQLNGKSVGEKIANILVFDEVTDNEIKVRKSYISKLWKKRKSYQRANTT